MSHPYNSRTGSGETKVESHAFSETQPNQAALLLNTARLQPGSQPHQCVGGNTVHLATWSARTALGPPQDARPIVRRPMAPQLCVAAGSSPPLLSSPLLSSPLLSVPGLCSQTASITPFSIHYLSSPRFQLFPPHLSSVHRQPPSPPFAFNTSPLPSPLLCL